MPRSRTPLERIADALIGLSIIAVIVVVFPALGVFVWLDPHLPTLARILLTFALVLGMAVLSGLMMLFTQMQLDLRREERAHGKH